MWWFKTINYNLIKTMAILKDPIFSNLSGRLGDYVFKQRYGKTIVCYMPKKQKKFDIEVKPRETTKSLISKFLNKNIRRQKS
jgi:hypothetical protein